MSCDVAAVDQLIAALAASKGDPVPVAAAGWSALCTGDGVLDAQLAQIPEAAVGDRWIVELQTSLLDGHRWNAACAGGTRALSMATKLDPSQRRPHLWTTCALEELGAFDATEWAASPGLMVLPIYAAYTLVEGGVPAEKARPIVRALAGLGR